MALAHHGLPTGTRFALDRSICAKCRRHESLTKADPHYTITASHAHNKIIGIMKQLQTEMIRRGELMADDKFVDKGVQEVKISNLIPSQTELEHPNKLCFVANHPVLNVPILVAKSAI